MTVAQLQQDLSEHHDRDAAGLKVGSVQLAWAPSCCSKTACCVAAHCTRCSWDVSRLPSGLGGTPFKM